MMSENPEIELTQITVNPKIVNNPFYEKNDEEDDDFEIPTLKREESTFQIIRTVNTMNNTPRL